MERTIENLEKGSRSASFANWYCPVPAVLNLSTTKSRQQEMSKDGISGSTRHFSIDRKALQPCLAVTPSNSCPPSSSLKKLKLLHFFLSRDSVVTFVSSTCLQAYKQKQKKRRPQSSFKQVIFLAGTEEKETKSVFLV